MNGKDDIKELFGEKLSGFEANVRPELWTNISSQITTVPAGTGMSLFTKVMIGVSVAASVGVIGFYMVKSSDKAEKPMDKSITSVSADNNEKNQEVIENLSNENNVSLPQDSGSTDSETPTTDPFQDLIVNFNQIDYLEPVQEQIVDDTPQIVEKQVENKETVPVANDNSTQNEPNVASISSTEQKEEKGTIGELFNVFTPNGDGANDVLYVESEDVTDFSVVIIDQQNKIVYQSTDGTFKWDGIGLNGDPVPAGNYLYYVTARNSAGKVLSKHSVLQINR